MLDLCASSATWEYEDALVEMIEAGWFEIYTARERNKN